MVFYGQTVDNIPDRGHVLFITALVMVIIAAIFVAIRLAIRIHARQLGWDDLFLAIGLVASVMTTVTINMGKSSFYSVTRVNEPIDCVFSQAVVNGYGRHQSDLGEKKGRAYMVCGQENYNSSKILTYPQWFFIVQVPYKIAVSFTKASIILLLFADLHHTKLSARGESIPWCDRYLDDCLSPCHYLSMHFHPGILEQKNRQQDLRG